MSVGVIYNGCGCGGQTETGRAALSQAPGRGYFDISGDKDSPKEDGSMQHVDIKYKYKGSSYELAKL
ncbi:hypothetical protein GX48_07101 [Paracoccidioides brasiliensis]|nr:hypothetical protein GX48_07101 [Paracoccidioides brasiliensis]